MNKAGRRWKLKSMSRERTRRELPPVQEVGTLLLIRFLFEFDLSPFEIVLKHIDKLKKVVEEGNYYGALQMYKSISARFAVRFLLKPQNSLFFFCWLLLGFG